MINKIKIKPCASLPGQGVKMSNVNQNGGLHGTWWSWIFMWSKTLFKVYLNYLNNYLIPDTYFSHIEVVRFAKYCPIKTKEEAYYGHWICNLWQCSECYAAAMPRIIRRCGLYGCTQKLFMSFLLPADYPPCGLSGGNYGKFIFFMLYTSWGLFFFTKETDIACD